MPAAQPLQADPLLPHFRGWSHRSCCRCRRRRQSRGWRRHLSRRPTRRRPLPPPAPPPALKLPALRACRGSDSAVLPSRQRRCTACRHWPAATLVGGKRPWPPLSWQRSPLHAPSVAAAALLGGIRAGRDHRCQLAQSSSPCPAGPAVRGRGDGSSTSTQQLVENVCVARKCISR